jgi:hypothetical protein
LGLVLQACVGGAPDGAASDPADFPEPSTVASSPAGVVRAPADERAATVWHSAGATVPGTVALDVAPTAVDLGAPAAWLVAAPTADGATLWVAVHDDGSVSAVTVDAQGAVRDADVGTRSTPTTRPPALHAPDGTWQLVEPPADAAEFAGVLPLGDGRTVTVTTDGDLLVATDDSGFPERHPGPYLPDARPIRVDDRRVALLFGPTDRYGHGVLGDDIEATQVRIVDVTSGTVTDTVVPEGRVIEGVRPLIGDLTGDGQTDLVVTTSAETDGARLEAWLLAGRGRRIGPAIGLAGRWRHQIAIAPTDLGGGTEVVEVITPHLDRVATFWRAGDQLLEATGDVADALVSHGIGSRSMEDAAVVDVDGDGVRELVGPGINGGLAIVRHGDDTTVATIEAPTPESNLAITALPGDRAALGYVTPDGLLVVWVGRA